MAGALEGFQLLGPAKREDIKNVLGGVPYAACRAQILGNLMRWKLGRRLHTQAHLKRDTYRCILQIAYEIGLNILTTCEFACLKEEEKRYLFICIYTYCHFSAFVKVHGPLNY